MPNLKETIMKSMRTWFVLAGFALAAPRILQSIITGRPCCRCHFHVEHRDLRQLERQCKLDERAGAGGFPNNGNGGVATYDAAISPVGAIYCDSKHRRDGRKSVAELGQCNVESHIGHSHRHRSDQSCLRAHTASRGGTIANSTINATVPISLTSNAANTLSGVTVNGDLSFLPGFNSKVVIAGGTTFSTAHMAGNYSTIGFAPAQTLSGTIQFEPGGDQSSVTMSSAGTFTVGTTGVIKTLAGLTGDVSVGNGAFAYNEAMALTNNGLISSQVSGRTLTINPATSFTNAATGTLEAKSGSILTIAPTGTWTNAGMISVNAATVNLGGTFNATGGIGTWSNTGGTVNVTGTITNTANTLTLNNATGVVEHGRRHDQRRHARLRRRQDPERYQHGRHALGGDGQRGPELPRQLIAGVDRGGHDLHHCAPREQLQRDRVCPGSDAQRHDPVRGGRRPVVGDHRLGRDLHGRHYRRDQDGGWPDRQR